MAGLFPAQSVEKLLHVIQSNLIDMMNYTQEAIHNKLEKNPITQKNPDMYAEFNEEISRLSDFTAFLQEESNKLNPWEGSSDFPEKLSEFHDTSRIIGFDRFTAEVADSNFPTDTVQMDFQLGDDGSFLRAYSQVTQQNSEDVLTPMDSEELDSMDSWFNAWLAQMKPPMVMQDGVIYAGNEDGEVIKEASASVTKARVERIKELLSDPEHGFQSYLEKERGQPVKISIISHSTEEAEATQQPDTRQ